MDIAAVVLSVLGSNGLLLFLVKRFFDKKDQKEAEIRRQREQAEENQRQRNDELYRKVDNSLETIRLLAYARMSEEIERLLTKGYATPAERRVLDEMFKNYKAHGWNGDMDARLEKVYALRTDHP